MKKALQLAHFRAEVSLPDGAAGRGPREACARSFFHCFAQFLGVDRGGPGMGLARLVESSLRQGLRPGLGPLWLELRKRSRSEPQTLRRRRSQRLLEARQDLSLEVAEL